MKTVAFILGTRPEIIKLAPLLHVLERTTPFQPAIIFSGQHQTMARQAFEAFELEPRIDLAVARANQSSTSFLGALLQALEPTLEQLKPVGIVIQGDTTTAFGAAIAGFQMRIPTAHVEAGLRTYTPDSPFPEEMNRTLISHLGNIHFCPHEPARHNLMRQGISEHVYLTGSPLVDSIRLMEQRLLSGRSKVHSLVAELSPSNRNYILVTAHRLENFDIPLKSLCQVLSTLAEQHPTLDIIFPVHPNPNIRELVLRELRGKPRIHVLPALDYPSFLTLLRYARFVITDSGGVQEEALLLRKKVFIGRKNTERGESIETGQAELVSFAAREKLLERLNKEIRDPEILPPQIPGSSGSDFAAAKQMSYVLAKEWS